MSYSPRTAATFATAAFVVAVAGCDERELPTTPRAGPDLSVGAQRPETSLRTIDHEFDRLAREEIPGFGGFYFDDDLNPVVYLTDVNRRTDAERWVGEV